MAVGLGQTRRSCGLQRSGAGAPPGRHANGTGARSAGARIGTGRSRASFTRTHLHATTRTPAVPFWPGPRRTPALPCSYLPAACALQYAETSAKEAQDVEEPFKLIAAAIKRSFDKRDAHELPGEEH